MRDEFEQEEEAEEEESETLGEHMVVVLISGNINCVYALFLETSIAFFCLKIEIFIFLVYIIFILIAVDLQQYLRPGSSFFVFLAGVGVPFVLFWRGVDSNMYKVQ